MNAISILAALCAILALVCALRLALLHRAIDELRAGMEEWLRAGDTNVLIHTASGDRHIRALAAGLNGHLRILRAERRKLQSGNAELTDAVTSVSHDLRTPLTAILGYLDLLKREELSDGARRHLAVIGERAEAMKSLTEELFRFSVLGANGGELALEPVSLSAAVEEALAANYAALRESGVTPEVEFPEAPVARNLNRAALGRILGNILTNAAKYSDGDLRITLRETGELRFSNAAPELNELQVGRLFDRFYTVESARQSTGLGLSIARVLTERMRGEIGAEYRDGRLTIILSFDDVK